MKEVPLLQWRGNHYSTVVPLANFQIITVVQTFRTRAHPAIIIEQNNPHFLRISNVKKKLIYFMYLMFFNNCYFAEQTTTSMLQSILNTSCPETIVICLPYLHNLHSFRPVIPFMTYTSFTISNYLG